MIPKICPMIHGISHNSTLVQFLIPPSRHMYLITLTQLGLGSLLAAAAVSKRAVSPFVSADGPAFVVNGNPLAFVGTNAYWLPTLNSADDIDLTLGNMSAMGINVVRTWAFNDVDVIPTSGTWFQLIANRTSTINTGPNGLQKLDTVVQMAQKHKIFVILCLTNNWNPHPLEDSPTAPPTTLHRRDTVSGTNNTLPRNTLSNDFGGMDAYVRGFGNGTTKHDEFYTDNTIQAHFLNYTTAVVSRYINSTAIFSWEIANDPRCFSSIASSSSCNPQVITKFHDTLSTHIKIVDKNHLVSSGSQGFLCNNCPKIFPMIPTQRRSVARSTVWGRWLIKPVFGKRRSRRSLDQGSGSAFDGSQGVDSEDILNAPNIGFGSVQLFPDQNSYAADVPTLPVFDNMLNSGVEWIRQQAAIGQLFGKPVIFTAFGLVTQSNSPFFVPFNDTQTPFGPRFINSSGQAFGVTDQQRDDAYSQWLQTGFQAGIQGMIQYQFSQGNLTASAGTPVGATGGTEDSSGVSGTGLSPNDGYANRDSVNPPTGGRRAAPRARIIGGAVGGISGIAIIGFLVFRHWSRRKRTSFNLLASARPLQGTRGDPFDPIAMRVGEPTAPHGRWTTGYGFDAPKREDQRNRISRSRGSNPNLPHADPLNLTQSLQSAPQVSTPNVPLSHSVFGRNRNGLTSVIGSREFDAGPVPRHVRDDDGTLPPDYNQLVDGRELRANHAE
ncbi:hypothetical protein D9619_003817 [Psilocybe cf. subviscida]|uniref:mannan endo-1,4-beta-mannosidase n=1 Tax=Psilocybe cf. subviscida TaxID=2480587 RepID=A0A8H5AXS6_9AGAR|nr:hypothetical protein D9619_003817 [Psilocybe cf. subviscida]